MQGFKMYQVKNGCDDVCAILVQALKVIFSCVSMIYILNILNINKLD